jgi:hypothetical protein
MLNPSGNEPHRKRREEYEAAIATKTDKADEIADIKKAIKRHHANAELTGETAAWNAYHDELVALESAAAAEYDAAQGTIDNYGGML